MRFVERCAVPPARRDPARFAFGVGGAEVLVTHDEALVDRKSLVKSPQIDG